MNELDQAMNALDQAIELVEKRSNLPAVTCPACRSPDRQVQIVASFADNELMWKCRRCGHWFTTDRSGNLKEG
jgi:transposase-like protein